MDETPSNSNDSMVSPELKQKLASLYQYMVKHLGIKGSPPKVIFTNSKKNAENPFGLTGYYDHTTKTIRIYVTGRHNMDQLRSFAHEVIHFWQDERGTLQQSTANNSSNMGAHYAQNDPWLRKREMEAYLFGNLLFRDWTDENRYGPPQNPPTLPQPLDENLQLADGGGLKKQVEEFVQRLISTGELSSYHRKLTSGDMNPADFANDLSHKILSAISEWTTTVNNRGNWENQSDMIK